MKLNFEPKKEIDLATLSVNIAIQTCNQCVHLMSDKCKDCYITQIIEGLMDQRMEPVGPTQIQVWEYLLSHPNSSVRDVEEGLNPNYVVNSLRKTMYKMEKQGYIKVTKRVRAKNGRIKKNLWSLTINDGT